MLDWAEELGIKLDGVFSDNIPANVKTGIFNLDKFGDGTHWTCLTDGHYFDPFGLAPPEHVKHLVTKYNTLQYQLKHSVLCGYFCLFFLKKYQDEHTFYDILYKLLNPFNPKHNEYIITDYFKNGYLQ